jgi:hypothetical protein
MEYDIVVGGANTNIYHARDDLKEKVERMIAEGWRPAGAATVNDSPGRLSRFTQTMVKD